MTLEQILHDMERTREVYWLRYPKTSPVKLHWRALTVRHCFHILPGESILEVGAGSGVWTEQLASVLRGENPITAAVFNEDLAKLAAQKGLPNTKFVQVADLTSDLPAESFDYVIGTAILCHEQYEQNLKALYRLLRPGGQLLFFEANYWNPQVFLKNSIRPLGRWAGNARCERGMRKYELMRAASHQGFTCVDVIPYDIVHPRTPRFLIPFVQSVAFVLEHAPVVREFCGTLYIWAKKPGDEEARRPRVNLANHRNLFGSTSIVVPCHNEEMNIPHLVNTLIQAYDEYIHEIIIVNDNSTDKTAEVTREVAKAEPRVRLINRKPPNGVGRALREGYAAATGRYILTMDCDFVKVVPEFRDLFDVIAEGHAGAIGSRFSHESILINYPFFKIICNRSFHVLVNLLSPVRVRDISNNLKLYRSDILKNISIEQHHFAANVETGLKPLLAGYDIREVPISWINRTIDMGNSSFKILKVAPNYLIALLLMLWNTWSGRRDFKRKGLTKAHPTYTVEVNLYIQGTNDFCDPFMQFKGDRRKSGDRRGIARESSERRGSGVGMEPDAMRQTAPAYALEKTADQPG
jgi:glycosyltransferase involved in cell wall biosynthesis/SAM-dependent methyltransferase